MKKAKKDDGGHAFPGDHVSDMTGRRWPHHGMSYRQWAAGRAMQGLISAESASPESDSTPETIAKAAVRFADALIAELKK